ncbi:glycolate oxidase subunit GlcE [Methylocapsa sp. S129]|uniref:glycolate oxidase subunit GlcE n=1 Tax=Methylocapsa sp. S129 TaxID=1641869 RepID=UPI00131B1567|nr:glycolate oxidase subunit GlcE [Methylocapsa sp. S129]
MVETLNPASEAEAAQLVLEARAKGRKLDIVGGGTRAGLGRPSHADTAISTAKMAGIAFYEPAEMVICAEAGTPVREIEALIAQRGQMLPFEPMDHRGLYGTPGEPTIGGLVAGNISGPRRISAGAARDALIGLRLVNGRGEIIKNGGRVMKNVTGLDLVKLNCGAQGTLGLVTQATFKLLPKPECAASIVIRRLDDKRAIEALSIALGSPFSVSGAAHISAGMGREFPRTFLRIEGFRASVDYRIASLLALLEPFGAKHALEDEYSERIWRAIGDATFLTTPEELAIWRVSLAPSKAADFVARVGAHAQAHFYDWGGGLVWLSSEATPDAAATIRAALAPLGGHATLVRAPQELRETIDVFEPLSAPLMQITKGVKTSFDPDGVFNAGRMYAGV